MNLPSHYDHTDEQFEIAFRDKTLNAKLFSHEAHLRLAFIHVKKYGKEKAIQNICTQIKAFDATFGDGSKYNATVTIAAINAVNHFMSRSESRSFGELVDRFPQLIYNFKDLLDKHYSFNIFDSEKAKSRYVAPDLLPF